MSDLPTDDGDQQYPEPTRDEGPQRYLYILEVQTRTPNQDAIDKAIATRIDHEFRNRFQLRRAEWRLIDGGRYALPADPVDFDPVLADGEAPPGYEPHPMPVVDHRRGPY